MKFFTAVLLLLPIALNAKLLEPILVGGSTSPWGTFPSAAFLSTSALRYCGAAVIHPEFVLTLAQCVYDVEKLRRLNTTEIEVIAGDINIVPASYDRQTRDALEVIVHPNYTVHNHRNDLALVRVEIPFHLPANTVDVVRRRSRIVPNGVYCEMPGWGLQRGTPLGSSTLDQRFLNVEILDRDLCNEINIHAGNVRESMICGGNLYQNANAPCSGNLGSPLYCDDELTGLLSFGVNCGIANDPPVFTQVRFFNRWIDQQIVNRVS